MSTSNRGGLTKKTGKIGRCNVLRQQIMMPGETMDLSVRGSVKLESLRERDPMRINAHLATFAQPLRWCFPNFPQYLKEGPDTAVTPPTRASEPNWAKYGVGSYAATALATMYDHYHESVLNIYNQWYRWPEDAAATTWNDDGNKAVPLSKAWNRCRYTATPDASGDYEIDVSGATMDVRDLAETQAKFRGAMKRDVFSFSRYMEVVNEIWKGDGSREVDQVPMLLDSTELGVDPREMPATDGASLGLWQSLLDFQVNHDIRGITAPEHWIITTILTIRFASITESIHPLATNRLDWYEFVGDPEYLAAAAPVEVQRRDLQQNNSATVLGYLPAGWQWRTDHDVIGQRVDERDSFPYMENPTTQAEAKDATRVKNAFRSSSLGDYLVDLYFRETCRQPIGDSMESYMSGMIDDAKVKPGGRGDEFPKGGKQL